MSLVRRQVIVRTLRDGRVQLVHRGVKLRWLALPARPVRSVVAKAERAQAERAAGQRAAGGALGEKGTFSPELEWGHFQRVLTAIVRQAPRLPIRASRKSELRNKSEV